VISLGIRSSLGFRVRIRFRVGIRCCHAPLREASSSCGCGLECDEDGPPSIHRSQNAGGVARKTEANIKTDNKNHHSNIFHRNIYLTESAN
jgi:hypothetical protein